ncbi:S1C family serine protease [Isoptericola sp. 178]|uniref:S1C family serine protease n=1 Tax=Isoptericola sp. 178 TaxID=3064651 RepID=UPI00271325D0|nr:trypsin-like peptidase domain-containing protein [Isoptericola sp. 178]MDO8143243.1 trypsin-like peptidase domain-containing protein [Isoptericola sp. 178]
MSTEHTPAPQQPSGQEHPVEQPTHPLPAARHEGAATQAPAPDRQAAPQPVGAAPSYQPGPAYGPSYQTGWSGGAPTYPPAAGAERRRTPWVPVVAAAAGAAVLASVATVGAVSLLDDGTSESSLAEVGASTTSQAAPVASSTSENPDWQAVTSAVAPSVVAIQVSSQSGGSEGSGVVVDEAGHVLTNNHVVAGAADGTVQVTLSDGRLYEATIVGTDPTTDLAVVQLVDPPDDLQPATFGDSDAVQVGDSVLAVGNPLGLANTATTGIVSALDRPVAASGRGGGDVVVTNAIQIDAAVNPGNSGGPLFDAQGRVVGITSSIATMSGGAGGASGSIGLGFAIPVNLATNVSDQLVEDGTAEHAFLGVSLRDATATADGVTRRGAEVVEVVGGSPAAEAGLQAGDVVVAIDDDSVSGAESLTAYVRERTAGESASVTYVRDGRAASVDVSFAVREETVGSGQGGQDQQRDQQQDQDQQRDQDQQQEGQDGSSDPTAPDNVPNWLRELFGD